MGGAVQMYTPGLISGTPGTPAPAGPASRLVVADQAEPVLSDNFNPFDAASSLYQMGVPFYIYEPLVEYDELGNNQYYPWLASSWSFSSSGSTITFNLRPNAKWDDGSRFTASDVAYTFNLLKDNPAINDGLPIVSAVATNPTTFTLTLAQPGYAYLYQIALVPIVKNGYAAGKDPAVFVDTRPDGTGPYVLARDQGFTPRRVVLDARAGYWQSGLPAIDELVFPAYPSDKAIGSALASGSVDWAGIEMTNVQAGFVKKDATDNHYWGPPVDCIALELNLARGATAGPAVRRAISDAINRTALSAAMSGGLDPPASSASGLVLPMDGQFLVNDDTGDIAQGGDLAAVAPVMRAAGFHIGAEGFWAITTRTTITTPTTSTPSRTTTTSTPTTASTTSTTTTTSARSTTTRPKSKAPKAKSAKSSVTTTQLVSLSIEDPVGTTLATGAEFLAGELRKAGFDATADLVPADRWRRDLTDGNYVATILAGEPGPSPFYMYQDWLDPAQVVGGHAVGGDYERLERATDPKLAAEVTSDLAAYTTSLSDSEGAKTAIDSLAQLVDQDLPVIPLLYGVAAGEFNTRHATGWPTSSDPYEPASPKAPFAEYTVLQLSAAKP